MVFLPTNKNRIIRADTAKDLPGSPIPVAPGGAKKEPAREAKNPGKDLTQEEALAPEPPGGSLKPILLLLFIAFLWSLNGLFIKMVDWHPLAISSTRSFVAAAALLLYYRRLRLNWSYPQVGGAFTYSLTMVFFVVANKLTTAANAILLQYTAPMFVALLSYWFLKERVTRFDWLATFAVMGGMVLFFLDELTLGSLGGNILAILSGVTFACFNLFMRKQKEGSPVESVILGSVITVFIGLPLFFLAGPPIGAFSWPAMALMGLFMALSFIIYSQVIRHIRAIEAVLVLILEPLLNPVWVFLIMGERPGPWSLVGGAVIVGSVALRGMTSARRIPLRKPPGQSPASPAPAGPAGKIS